ncbi:MULTISPECIES: hypothetical protein [unclassified Streptomyces]|uniref:hypothetical protein n=1 Tax=unclassified Streptomyces TaxID=2593676 RepID=UPI00380DC35D
MDESGRDVTQVAQSDQRQVGGGEDAAERLGNRLRVWPGAVLAVKTLPKQRL